MSDFIIQPGPQLVSFCESRLKHFVWDGTQFVCAYNKADVVLLTLFTTVLLAAIIKVWYDHKVGTQ